MVSAQTLSELGLTIDKLGTAKANPNKASNNLITWYLINIGIVIIYVLLISDSVLINALSWILKFITTKYINQILLFILVIITDLLIMFLVQNTNIINGGFLAVVTYFVLDYVYLVNHFAQYSLLNLIGN